MLAHKHPSLTQPPVNLIAGKWQSLSSTGSDADRLQSVSPAHPDRVVYSAFADPTAVNPSIAAARAAFPDWARWGRDNRFRVLRRFADLTKKKATAIAELISDETGKAMWEAKGEASALAAKVDITLDTAPTSGLARVNGYEFEMGPGKLARCSFKPHGVMAVLGPFNFPAHLPNGHIVPALALGNTVVFKPSDKTPAVGQLLVELLDEALRLENAPNQGQGVINLIQGGSQIAAAISSHPDIDGILFTGSWPVGKHILSANLDRPGRIIALELGGNNPAVVLDDANLKQAAIEVVRCAFNTTGQRCTSTRRLIVHERVADWFIDMIVNAAKALVFADPRSTSPVFAGPIINQTARQAALDFQNHCQKAGATIHLAATSLSPKGAEKGFFISPSIIEVERFSSADFDPKAKIFDPGCDHEVFAPMLRLCRVRDLDQALEQANATRYGLAASIFTQNQQAAERFLFDIKSGCINVNAGTAGASSKLPFGGTGLSGNHRPAGSFSLDYCAYPVAGMFERGDSAQLAEGMRWDDKWNR